MKKEKSHWYYFTYQCESNSGTRLGSGNFPFSDRIEGDNFELSLNLYRTWVSDYLTKESVSGVSSILITTIFYIGHFEEMAESK